MNSNNVLQAGLFIVVLLAAAVPLARYLSAVMDGSSRVVRLGGPLERLLYRVAGVDPSTEMGWKHYAIAVIAFNVLGVVVVYVLQRAARLAAASIRRSSAAMSADPRSTRRSASSPTPTGRATRGESTMSYLTQMLALTVQNFFSAATGIAVVIALIRGFARHTAQDHRQLLGRPRRASTLYMLLPLSLRRSRCS